MFLFCCLLPRNKNKPISPPPLPPPPSHVPWLLQNCSSHVRRAVVTCFSAGCCGRHGNRPVRYCKRCHVNHHSSEVGAAAETHLYQTSPPPINTRECGAEELVCTVEAVIRCIYSVYTDMSHTHSSAYGYNAVKHVLTWYIDKSTAWN